MADLANFPLLFEQIHKYLHEAGTPDANEKDLQIARDAYSKIVETIYGSGEVFRCGGVRPVIRRF